MILLSAEFTLQRKLRWRPIITLMAMRLSTFQSLESLSSKQLAIQRDVTGMNTNVCNLTIKASGEHLERCWLGLRQAILMGSRRLLYKFGGHRAH